MIINHNIVGLTAQRSLNRTTSQLQKTIERLSTGFRINTAADDAAGLAISEKLRSQISGLEIAQRNSQDGISMLQTAEGALEEVHNILRRIRDLTQLAANGDKTDNDRAHYQHEINQLLDEIDRIGKTTEYNTLKLLDGSLGSRAYEKADVKNINNTTLTKADGIIKKAGEYVVKVDRPASQATSYLTGVTFATGNEPTLDEAGGMYKLLGATATEPSSITIQIEVDGKETSVTLDVAQNSNDTISNALNKINSTLESEGIQAHAYYHTDVDSTVAGSQAGIAIIADNFGSKHDIKMRILSDTSGSSATTHNTNPLDSNGEIPDTTVIGDGLDQLHISTGQFVITDRSGSSATITVNSGDTIADIVNNINAAGIGVTASWNSKEYRFEFKDTSGGKGTFQINEVGGGYTAEDLGIYGSIYGDEYYGVAISNTRDFILNVTDPDGETAILRGSHGDRSTYFAAAEGTDFAVLSSGVDPDGGGVEVRGKGGIKGISFTLNEKVLEQDDYFIINAKKGSLTLQVGPNDGADHRIEISGGEISAEALGLLDSEGKLDITTQANAFAVIDSTRIDKAIDEVSDLRARFGAMQNRIEHTMRSLAVAHDNLQNAESHIRDLDMAKETMEMTRLQILMQSGTAMLSQANIIPQAALQLFK